MPTIAQPSFWKSLVPKPLRSSSAKDGKPKSREWNPATFFIAIFLLIGSMSIQMISLKKDFAAFTRQSDVRIGLLREVVEKLQRGEEVDVEKVLGTGDAEKEIEWQEVLNEIEKEEMTRDRKKKQAEPTPNSKREEEQLKKAEPTNGTAQTSSPSRASFF
ncbi:hypothetical protein QBC33DRAFT_557953 [Phialemonium atrogriseum]|uniref:Uncharacterized protein n=1 Tax=Phialemonium atrogriseum TaxID=1093897 RepID=A0AAJ0C3N1_9PEZI|nr:uncharacterized protein QBC33DRAFT_557953 [Phialemonium atrogriseum]KAK1768498.1 hypothetical protein QBC33DRAFT_557953 [Phialemonium atrogriseum]